MHTGLLSIGIEAIHSSSKNKNTLGTELLTDTNKVDASTTNEQVTSFVALLCQVVKKRC